MPIRSILDLRNLIVLGIVLAFACAPAPHADPVPASTPVVAREPIPAAAAPPSSPRCVRAGGICVGPSAIAASPGAPCPAGRHRVDDVAIVDPGAPAPACFGIPVGEEACCMPDPPGR